MTTAHKIQLFASPLLVGLLTACAADDSILDNLLPGGSDTVIRIGGIDHDNIATSLGGYTSRAAGDDSSVDAETVDWLLGPLFGGLDIMYGAKDDASTERVAILQLLKKDPASPDISSANIKYSSYEGLQGEKIAEYSFRYRNSDGSTGDDAKWYDNGLHFFQGVFVPEKLRFNAVGQTPETVFDPTTGKAPALKLDQSKDDATEDPAGSGTRLVDTNYTLLERYLGMPADAYIHATVGRVKLPFRHRLARVQAYVLIDPTMGSDVTINGYKKHADGEPVPDRDDASTSDIRFCNVKVLAGVRETDNAEGINGHALLTPVWDKQRKVIPHFVDERTSVNSNGVVQDEDNFIMFYDSERKVYIFPANDDAWTTARSLWDQAYTNALNGGTTDEEKRIAAETADKKSGYKRTLYGRVPCYDLIVRPTYTSEDMVMYDEDFDLNSRRELAEESNLIDFELTLNNGLRYEKEFVFDLNANFETIVYLRINRESIDYNSSGAEAWRETRNDDGYYGVNNLNGNTLSYAGSSWQRAYRFSNRNVNITDGHYYGKDDDTDDNAVQDDDEMPWYPQYVDKTQWVKMFAEAHEGGLHHGDYFILDDDITIDATLLPADFVFTGHLDGQDHTITVTGLGQTVVDSPAWDEDNFIPATAADYSADLYVKPDAAYIPYVMPTLYTKVHHDDVYFSQDEIDAAQPGDPAYDKTTNDIKTEAYDQYLPASPTVGQMMSGTYYVYTDGTYSPYAKPTLYANHPIHHPAVTHVSGSTLFAGLNGAYSAAMGEANVHVEKGIYVPYVDASTGTGWRAEIINTRLSGAELFPASVLNADGSYDVNHVSGYIYNCWKDGNKVKPHTPTLPRYN